MNVEIHMLPPNAQKSANILKLTNFPLKISMLSFSLQNKHSTFHNVMIFLFMWNSFIYGIPKTYINWSTIVKLIKKVCNYPITGIKKRKKN